jgi:hypothetical protein
LFQVFIDNQRRIRYVHSGFLGHDNDSATYARMPTIGPGEELDFPADGNLLGASIYPCRHPIVTPYGRNQIVRQPPAERMRRLKFNRLHRHKRVYVEHLFKEIKTFRVIASVCRHDRWQIASIVELCAGLAQRRVDMLRVM